MNSPQDSEKRFKSEANRKLRYASPSLAFLGTVADLTGTGSGTHGDGVGQLKQTG